MLRSQVSRSNEKLDYRPDIDGLRAIAVLSVLGFHAFPRWVPGGFVGVDVFFVISGYLISLVILKDLLNNQFSFANFYGRRVQRIFPALVIVLAAWLVFGWCALLGPEFRQLGKQGAGSAGFVSNFVLMERSGYFAGDSDLKPLLHLWSLGIEEQFYIVWPLLFYLAWRAKVSITWVVMLVTVASFSLNLSTTSSSDAFYLPTTRAWELGAGCTLALALSRHTWQPSRFLRESLAVVGVLCIAVAIFLLNSRQPYPGTRTLAPVIGAVLLIAAGSTASINRLLLTNRLLVGCGWISYPLYLWHWPLLSFGHIVSGGWITPGTRVLLLLLSVILAAVTYWVIEKPLRFGEHRGLKRLSLLAAMLVIGCVSFLAWDGRVPSLSEVRGVDRDTTNKLLTAASDWDFPGEVWEPVPVRETTFVRYRGQRDRRVIWFFGDSTMEQYAPRIRKLIEAHPQVSSSAVFTTRGGCAPIPSLQKPEKEQACNSFFARSMEYGKSPEISTAVLGAAWPYIFDGKTYFYPDDRKGTTPEDFRERVYRDLEAVLTGMHAAGRSVYLLLSNPMGDELDPARTISRHASLNPFGFRFTVAKASGILADTDAPVQALRTRLREIAARSGAQVIDPYESLCPNNICKAFDDQGEPIYKDETHLRASFVREQVSFIDRVLDGR